MTYRAGDDPGPRWLAAWVSQAARATEACPRCTCCTAALCEQAAGRNATCTAVAARESLRTAGGCPCSRPVPATAP